MKDTMLKFAIFASLLKVDEAAHTVTGVIADETRDLTGEIFDYDTSKPHFDAWSNGIAKATEGKSVGNVRAMHGNVVAGKLNELLTDDATKSISVTAHIVDDNEWNKVLTGCYTGFSIGGKYEKKWDAEGGKRYTAIPSEVSIVDLPCNPSAQFTVIKADGASEMRKFVVDVLALCKAAPDLDALKAVIAEHSDELITKEAAPGDGDVTVLNNEQAQRLFAKIEQAAPVADALNAVLGNEPVAKGMWNVQHFADLLSSLASLTAAAKSEASSEGDASPVPAKLQAATAQLGAIFLELAAEEVDELLANTNSADTASFAYAAPAELQKASDDLAAASTALAKAAEDMAKVAGERDAAVATLAEYKRTTPAPAKGSVLIVNKATDGQSAIGDKSEDLRKQVEAMPDGEDKVRALIKLAHINPV